MLSVLVVFFTIILERLATVVCAVILVLVSATETSDSLTHAAVVLIACAIMALVFVSLEVRLAVVQLGFDTSKRKQDHQDPEKHLRPFDFTQVAIFTSKNDCELVDVATGVHGNTL